MMLRICIRIENPVLRDAICEILPQAGLQVLEEEKGSAAILYTPPYDSRPEF